MLLLLYITRCDKWLTQTKCNEKQAVTGGREN